MHPFARKIGVITAAVAVWATSAQASVIGWKDAATDVESYLNLHTLSDEQRVQSAEAFHAVAKLSNGCTGWMLTQRLLVTNQHCVTSPDFCKNRRISFGHQEKRLKSAWQGCVTAPDKGVYSCKKVVLADPAHDVAILELDRPRPPEYKPLRLAKNFKPEAQPIAVIGHPAGSPKKISYFHPRFRQEDEPCVATPLRFPEGKGPEDSIFPKDRERKAHSFQHNCDTKPGSSGSPILDAHTLEVVGLHWGGFLEGTWGLYSTDDQALWDAKQKEFYRPGNFAVSADDLRGFLLSLRESDFDSSDLEIRAEIQSALLQHL